MNIRYYYKLGTVSVKEVESKSAMGSAMGSEIADKRTSSSLSLGFQIFNCPQRTTPNHQKMPKVVHPIISANFEENGITQTLSKRTKRRCRGCKAVLDSHQMEHLASCQNTDISVRDQAQKYLKNIELDRGGYSTTVFKVILI
jgi:hypothetical protein